MGPGQETPSSIPLLLIIYSRVELAPRVMRVRDWPCSSPEAIFRRMGPAPCLSSRVRLSLVAGIAGEPALRMCERERQQADSSGKSQALRLMAGRRADPLGVMTAGELALPTTCCSTQESRPCNLTWATQ